MKHSYVSTVKGIFRVEDYMDLFSPEQRDAIDVLEYIEAYDLDHAVMLLGKYTDDGEWGVVSNEDITELLNSVESDKVKKLSIVRDPEDSDSSQ